MLKMPAVGESFRYDVEDTMQTLNGYIGRIREYAVAGIGDPYVLDAARKITSCCKPYDQKCETKTIFDFIRSRVKYTPAPARYGKEVLQTAEKMLKDIESSGRASGECEEMATLMVALLANLNIETALVYGASNTIMESGVDMPNYRHVWVAARVNGVTENDGWVHLDATGYHLKPGQHFEFSIYGWDFLS